MYAKRDYDGKKCFYFYIEFNCIAFRCISKEMGSSWAFKITASLIKPTRESLLDYCSYILLIIALISIARVIIGREGLRKDCYELDGNVSQKLNTAVELQDMLDVNVPDNLSRRNASDDINFPSGLEPHVISLEQHSSPTKKTVFNNSTPVSNISSPPIVAIQKEVCVKHYQTYFSYFILVEAIILLLVGILWVKMPKVLSIVNDFCNLFKDCQNSSWLSAAFNEFQFSQTTNSGNPLYAIIKSDSVNMEVEVLLASLFQNNTSYHDKAEARRLYERVQKFCSQNDTSIVLWQSYIQKSIYQCILWMTCFGLNMLLFIKMEFYIGCSSSATVCDHDTFLRIAWFMAQLTIIIYGIFNFASLKWINDKSTSESTLLSSVCGCFVYANPIAKQKKNYGFVCLPYSVGKQQKRLHNDVALLFHLVSSSNAKKLPLFTIFLFKQWEEKFKQAGETVMMPRLKNLVHCQTANQFRKTSYDDPTTSLLGAAITDTVV